MRHPWDLTEEERESIRYNEKMIHERWMDNGRITLRPTVAMCRAFENVSMSFRCADYRQPYKFIKVELPTEIANELQCHYGIVYHGNAYQPGTPRESAVPSLLALCPLFERNSIGFSENINTTPDMEIEQRLFTEHTRSWQEGRATKIVRLVLNACIAATGFPNRLIQETPPANWPRKKRREFEQTAPCIIQFIDQHIRWYDEETEPAPATPSDASNAGEGHHARPVAHWRRGHWRRQRVGHQRSESRLVFIRPVLVNAAYYAGDPATTKVEYVGKPQPLRLQN